MTPERWQKIVDLAERAADLSADERSAFLQDACAWDAALRKEVESLLASDEDARSFIETPAAEVAAELIASAQPESLVGQDIGAYRIINVLGAGSANGGGGPPLLGPFSVEPWKSRSPPSSTGPIR